MPGTTIKTRTSGIMVPAFVAPTTGYQGPGDFASFASWWGLRAYSSAKLSGSTKAMQIGKASDGSNPTDINILATGSIDVAAITGHPDYPSVTCITLYDQVGSNNFVTSGTGARFTVLVGASGLGGSTVSLATGPIASAHTMTASHAAAIVQTFSMSAVCVRRSSFTTAQTIFSETGTDFTMINYEGVSNQARAYAGTASLLNNSATDNTWNAMNARFSGATSRLRVNGTSVDNDAGTNGFVNTETYTLNTAGAGLAAGDLEIVECGIATTDISGVFASIESNQRSYWGF